MRRSPSEPQRRGFTLMELLVVITIIAILAAMLLPAIQLVRQMALSTRCAANVRQMNLAAEGYSQDWDGLLLPVTVGPLNASFWGTLLAPYLETNASAVVVAADTRNFLRSCPLWKTTVAYRDSIADTTHYPNTGYGLTIFTIGKMPPIDPVTLTCHDGSGNLVSGYGGYSVPGVKVSKPTQRIRMSDSLNYMLWPTYTTLSTLEPDFDRHRGRSNVLFFDGHLETATKGQITAGVELVQ